MFIDERFTERAKYVVTQAHEEARTLNHNYIGTEHILLSSLSVEGGTATRALKSLDVQIGDVRESVEAIIGKGIDASRPGQLPFTPRAKKVIELAVRESMQFGCTYVGTEHILLGLIREGEGVAAQVLWNMRIYLFHVRDAVRELLGSSNGEPYRHPDVGGTATANAVTANAVSE